MSAFLQTIATKSNFCKFLIDDNNFLDITVIAATESYSASEYGKFQIELINGRNEECRKQGGNQWYAWDPPGLFQKSFKQGTAIEQAEAVRSLVAACGDSIDLRHADDSQVMALAAVMEWSPIRFLQLSGSFGAASLEELKRVAEANGLTVYHAHPHFFEAN